MAKAIFEKLNALMWVSDVPRALEFYTSKLGCEEAYTCGEDDGKITFAIVQRNDICFHLEVCACDDGRHTGNSFVEVEVDEIQDLCDEYDAAGVEFVKCLKEEDWASRSKSPIQIEIGFCLQNMIERQKSNQRHANFVDRLTSSLLRSPFS